MTDLNKMDVHEALDKARAENERLEEEIRTKTDLYNNLRKAQHELVTKFQETKLQSEKQAKELNAKSEDMISKLEENLRDVEDQLKWKNEQFEHLEEAHERLQDNFRSSKAEWEKEKSLLLEEISSVQRSLDSQIRISETLQTQLKICNQALAHEESTRKMLEVEVSEYKSRFDNIFLECHEAKATIEKLSHKRDEEVAELRDTLATKDSVSKEMGYKMAHLEQENQDLITSLKEFQESVIVKCGQSGSLKKLQKKYQDLEQLHKKCSENLKEKEVEWKSYMEKAKKEMDEYLSKLKLQDEKVEHLQKELEDFQIQNHKDGLDDLSDKFVKLEKEKLLAERQGMLLETSLQACKSENESLLCKTNEQNEKVLDLQQQLVLLETMVTERTETIEAQKQEKDKYFKIIQDKESSLENMLIGFEQEKKSLLQVIEERNKRIEELIEEITNAFKSLEEKQTENDVINQSLHKMEIEVSDLCEKMKLKDELLLQASQHEEELQVLLETKKLEIEKMKEQFGDEKRQLEVENQGLHEDVTKLLSDREDLIIQMEKMSEQIGEFSKDDELLMSMLDNMLKKSSG
ncbi:hypothetical protein L1887_04400 [Cichorium endivia]|nr:hypothetical protein L1887_04400 [Cichorium endivia]